jgi:NAD(P)-dependent dehydrogenase (short-subunit alcohol dehydrogenase family)
MKSCLDLYGRVAVVIGGTSGLGKAIALGLAAHGASVVASARTEQAVEETSLEIEALGRRTVRHVVDVDSRESIDTLRDNVAQALGGVDILVNAAGYTFRKPTAEISEPEWDSLTDTNLHGVLRACQS